MFQTEYWMYFQYGSLGGMFFSVLFILLNRKTIESKSKGVKACVVLILASLSIMLLVEPVEKVKTGSKFSVNIKGHIGVKPNLLKKNDK